MHITLNNTKATKKEKKSPIRKKKPKLEDFKWVTQYKDFMLQKMMPVSEMAMQRIAHDLVQWAINDKKALKISQFFLKLGIPPDTFYDWIKNYPVMKDAHSVAMQAIGDRREIAALHKNLDTNMVTFTMPEIGRAHV